MDFLIYGYCNTNSVVQWIHQLGIYYILTIKTRFIVCLFVCVYIYIQARFACLRCAAGGHFVSAGGSLRSPGVTLVNYKGENIYKYVNMCYLSVKIDITREITKKIF